MSHAHVRVSRYSIQVDTRDTLTEAMRGYDTDRGAVWDQAMTWLTSHRSAAYVQSPDRPVDPADYDPRIDVPDGIELLDWAHESSIVRELHRYGYLAQPEMELILAERAEGTYLDEARYISAVTVVKPFRVVTVHYWDYPVITLAERGYARQWKIWDQVVVPSGTYVIAEYGDYATRVHSVGWTDQGPPSVEDLAGIGGFWATRCDAGCDTCDGEWMADDGSWRFFRSYDGEPLTGRKPEWTFDAAEGFDDDDRISCPVSGCNGRVGFMVH